MKNGHLLYNPTAGEQDISAAQLVKMIKKQGFNCTQASVKKEGWDQFDEQIDFLICVGGDGTVRRIAKALLKRTRLAKHFPVAILPHGTANNVAYTLGVPLDSEDAVSSWNTAQLKKFDIGKVYGFTDDLFFLEGFGCGIFPRLMKEMGKLDLDDQVSRSDRIKLARVLLHDIVQKFEPVSCKIVADGLEHSGNYIMVEVMNTKSIGPNLELAPQADPGDGEFDVVLIPESHQQKFATFLLNRINGGEEDFSFTTLKASNLTISWQGKDAHLDDERLKPDGNIDVRIELQSGAIDFLV
jgi:diacylglycerol kinase (ATP)